MNDLDPDKYDDDMAAIAQYGEDLDIVKAAIQEFLEKYPAVIHATLLLEHDMGGEDTGGSGIMMAGDALGPEGAQDRLRAVRNCARFIEDCMRHLQAARGDFDEDDDEYELEDEAEY